MVPAQEVTPGSPTVTATPITRRHSWHRGVFRSLPLSALSWTPPMGKLSTPCSFEFSHISCGYYGEVWGLIWVIASQNFLKTFWCGPFWKSLLNLLQHCFCFLIWFFGHKVFGILAPRPRIKPTRLALEGDVLTTGPPGKSQLHSNLKVFIYLATLGFPSDNRWACDLPIQWMVRIRALYSK